MPRPSPLLFACVDSLATRYDRAWLESDPLRWPRQFPDPRDREVVAVVSALLAYGRVASIHRSIAAALSALGPSPARAIAPSRRHRLADALAGFRHRFTSGLDLAWLLRSVAAAWDAAGSLGRFIGAHGTRGQNVAPRGESLRAGLAAWRRLAERESPTADRVRLRARRFLLADPTSGAACKRSLLLARWCVRGDDGLDLGLWSGLGLAPADLLIPLDTHVHRVAKDVGLTRRPVADWRAAVEVTTGLARLDPADPVRFDFALARPGIVGRCQHRLVQAICSACDLAPCCRHGRRLDTSSAHTPARAPTGVGAQSLSRL